MKLKSQSASHLSMGCVVISKHPAEFLKREIIPKYFLIAILFVLFDVEVIFMYPWAVNFKELGSIGMWEMFTFMGIFLLGFVYIVKKGALKWE